MGSGSLSVCVCVRVRARVCVCVDMAIDNKLVPKLGPQPTAAQRIVRSQHVRTTVTPSSRDERGGGWGVRSHHNTASPRTQHSVRCMSLFANIATWCHSHRTERGGADVNDGQATAALRSAFIVTLGVAVIVPTQRVWLGIRCPILIRDLWCLAH